jgi:Fur family iron response transcriptional regulator
MIDRLKEAKLRPTRQRLALAELLFGQGDRHVTPEQLHREAALASIKVSLATIYNTLNQFTEAGLLREVIVSPGETYFDTNAGAHHHFYHVGSGQLMDIENDRIQISGLPALPKGATVSRVDVIIRIDNTSPKT